MIERDGEIRLYRVWVGGSKAYLEEGIAHLIVKNQWSLLGLWRDRQTLEDVFREKTMQAQVEALGA